jgi:hypothetical protein
MSTFRVGVFGSSSKTTAQRICDESFRLGELIAERGHVCVNGAGSTGVMGYLNEGARSKGGRIKGVIHRTFIVDSKEDVKITDLVVTNGDGLNERKDALFEESDCLIVMPGGVGTFDEFWDVVCARSLNMKGVDDKPICLVNLDGFYDGFVMQLQKAFDSGMLYMPIHKFFRVENTVEDALNWCEQEHNHPKDASSVRSRRRDPSSGEFASDKYGGPLARSEESTPRGEYLHDNHYLHLAIVGSLSLTIGILVGLKLRK